MTPVRGSDDTATNVRLARGSVQATARVCQPVGCPLITKSLEEQSGDIAVPGLPLLTRRGWIPRRPLPLDQVQLNYSAPRADTFDAAKRLLAPYWPAVEGMRVPTYSAAVLQFAKPPMFFDAPSFRLLGLDPTASERTGRSTALQFTMGSYYDWIDTGEALGYEAAKRYAESGGASIIGPYRESLRGPFDFAGRCATPGINTLTIRASRRRSFFYLHRRTSVATARGTVHVVPAGEFQPSGGDTEGHAVGGADLDVRSTIIREYMEEILGRPDVINPTEHVTPVDFMSDPEYAAVESALRGAVPSATTWEPGSTRSRGSPRSSWCASSTSGSSTGFSRRCSTRCKKATLRARAAGCWTRTTVSRARSTSSSAPGNALIRDCPSTRKPSRATRTTRPPCPRHGPV